MKVSQQNIYLIGNHNNKILMARLKIHAYTSVYTRSLSKILVN